MAKCYAKIDVADVDDDYWKKCRREGTFTIAPDTNPSDILFTCDWHLHRDIVTTLNENRTESVIVHRVKPHIIGGE